MMRDGAEQERKGISQGWIRDLPSPAIKPDILAREVTIGSSAWQLELWPLGPKTLSDGFLSQLSQRAAGLNPFFSPAFLSASAGRLGISDSHLLALVETVGESREARLAFPVGLSRAGLPPTRVMRVASHPFAPLSFPLVDPDDLAESCERFAGLLAKAPPLVTHGIVFDDFPADEPSARILIDALNRHGLSTRHQASARRASLLPGQDPEKSLSTKRRREHKRQFRKLSEMGDVTMTVATDFWDVLVRFEEFLLLETRGWKGRKGTSIHIIRKTAAFARQAVAAFAEKGHASIHTVRIDNRAIASLIILEANGRYFPWKTAFDEHYRTYSPGTHLMLSASKWMLEQPGFAFADSLAAENGWMDRLWTERHALETLVIAKSNKRADTIITAIANRQKLRHMAKSAIRRDWKSVLRPPAGPFRETPAV
ncbi:MAG: GNAT family N-acetyltransferase [Nitratireductor sp.]